MVDYVRKLFLSVSWVSRWRKYARKHLQTHLRGPCTILHTQNDYFLHWILDKKNSWSGDIVYTKKKRSYITVIRAKRGIFFWVRYNYTVITHLIRPGELGEL